MVSTFDCAIFKNCDWAPDLGGSIIIAPYSFNSLAVRGFDFKFLVSVFILFLKVFPFLAKSIDWSDSAFSSNALILKFCKRRGKVIVPDPQNNSQIIFFLLKFLSASITDLIMAVSPHNVACKKPPGGG